jgi:hypothetical protein
VLPIWPTPCAIRLNERIGQQLSLPSLSFALAQLPTLSIKHSTDRLGRCGIVSIYGMNFHHMPEFDWRLGYPLAVAVMILAAILPYLYFKWRKWL